MQEQLTLWPVNQDSWELFMGVATQLRTVGMGNVIGIDYAALKMVSELYGIPLDKERFHDIQAMEREAVSIWSR